jgi:hypothetical protein
MTEQEFEMTAGDDKILQLTITESGSPANLTGCTIRWVMARGYGWPPVLEKSTGAGITITNAAGGVFQVSLAAADTLDIRIQPHVWEAEIIDTQGKTATTARGRINFRPNTAKASS